MVDALFGIKKHMTSVYDSKGRRVGATIISLPANFVTQIKTTETDGYMAIQLGTQTKKSVKKPQQGHLKKASAPESTRFLKEVRVDTQTEVTPGQQIKITDVFHTGDLVKVQGVSKGKGFQGGVRRHGFHGGPKTHGQSDRHRAPGSVGQGTTPGRVYKGKRMAGHMGVDTVSVKGLEVVKIDRVNEEIIIKGGVPGPIGGLLKITYQGQVKGYVPVEEPEEVVSEEIQAESGTDDSQEPSEGQEVTEQIAQVAENALEQEEVKAESAEDVSPEDQAIEPEAQVTAETEEGDKEKA